ncbi:MAG: hypothetical protein ACRC33_06620 [Gemmataceae bacterium]
MNFAEQPPSTRWAALKYRGEPFAEVWFKPDGDPLAVSFRIPRESFDLPGLAGRLKAENLLKAVGVAAEDIAALPDVARSLTPPPPGVTHLELRLSLTPPPGLVPESDVAEARWQEFEARWNAVLGLEATVEGLRISLEALRAEMEVSSRRNLTAEERVNALNADVAQWTKARSRVLHAVPKVKDFIHRSTWATGAPERKRLEEIVQNHIRPRVPYPRMGELAEQLESLLKDRQVLSALGVSVLQECKGISNDVQGALRTLQGNASANGTKKRGAANARGKSF